MFFLIISYIQIIYKFSFFIFNTTYNFIDNKIVSTNKIITCPLSINTENPDFLCEKVPVGYYYSVSPWQLGFSKLAQNYEDQQAERQDRTWTFTSWVDLFNTSIDFKHFRLKFLNKVTTYFNDDFYYYITLNHLVVIFFEFISLFLLVFFLIIAINILSNNVFGIDVRLLAIWLNTYIFRIVLSLFFTSFIEINFYSYSNIYFSKLIFNFLFSIDYYLIVIKCFICFLVCISCLLIYDFIWFYKGNLVEYSFLLGFSGIMMIFLLMSFDFLVFYLIMEVISLTLFLLISLGNKSHSSVESGLKYFSLNSIFSGNFLFGVYLIYSGTLYTDFTHILLCFQSINIIPVSFKVGSVLILSVFLFKISAFPFNIWVSDVYSGCPLSTIFYISVAVKTCYSFILIRLVTFIFLPIIKVISPIFLFSALGSLTFGALSAVTQVNLKKFLAYTSVNQIGFLLLSISCFSSVGLLAVEASLLFIINYCLSMILFLGLSSEVSITYTTGCKYFYWKEHFYPNSFSNEGEWGVLSRPFLPHSWNEGNDFRQISLLSDFSFLRNLSPFKIFLFSLSIFSLAGLPPFLGFFTKFYILLILIKSKKGLILIYLFFILGVSTFYYVKIIHYLYLNIINRFFFLTQFTLSEIYFLNHFNVKELIILYLFVAFILSLYFMVNAHLFLIFFSILADKCCNIEFFINNL